MYKTKVVEDAWLIDEEVDLDELVISEGGSIVAPEGKFVTMTVYGVTKTIRPGEYKVICSPYGRQRNKKLC